jgi:membrane fusion protein, heavy metal efflux system
VRIHVLAYPDRVFNARISWIAPTIDPKTHRLAVRADVANKDGALKPMMFARFTIAIGPERKAPAVPEEAVIHRGDSERVWVVAPDGSLAARTIKTGRSHGDMVEVVSGLKAGERVVTAGALFIDRAARGD